MKCTICGAELAENATFCEKCGAIIDNSANAQEVVASETVASEVVADPAQDPGKTLGIASLICGILSLVGFGWLPGVIGVILGFISKKKSAAVGLEAAKPTKIGIILSIVGIVLGILAAILAIIIIVIIMIAAANA